MKKICISVCNLNQLSMDFDNNLNNIIESLKIAKSQGSKLRVGSELEVTGYSCDDHFLELDTYQHCWESIKEILTTDLTNDILCCICMPVIFENNYYNCSLFIYNKEIILIRPKKVLCNDGNYRESRYFTNWDKNKILKKYIFPKYITEINGQFETKFGDAVLSFYDVKIGCEMCEELWYCNSPHIDFSLQGVHIICNPSGSHHQLRKLHKRIDLIKNATSKCGGIYLYSNQIGCDGNRLYFDGSSLISCNGEFYAQGKQFSVENVEVLTSNLDLDSIESYRGNLKNRSFNTEKKDNYPEIFVNKYICGNEKKLTEPIDIIYNSAMEEISKGPALWLWDYLKNQV